MNTKECFFIGGIMTKENEKIKQATDLEVKQVNIKVKNIASSKEEKSKK